jgi:catechol 2,3-dioxygenase-like lactoylglutathione lyase family enzyme
MKTTFLSGALLGLILFASAPAMAQLAPPNEAGVTLSHIHIIVNDMDAQKKFWTTAMGGTLIDHGPFTMIQLPEVFLVLEKGQAIGPSEGTVLNHFGFAYKDLPAQLARWKEMNVRAETNANGHQGYVYGADGMRFEYAYDEELSVPFRMDHLHMNIDIPAAHVWYEKTFGAPAGQRKRNAGPGTVECNFFPGMTVSMNPVGGRGAATPLLPTKGHTLDHFGFEVKDLNAFVKKLQADGVKFDVLPQTLPGTKIRSAFFTDPFGNYIELTENFVSAAR